MKHGAVGMESVAKGRARSVVVEEGEERGRGEGERVEGDEGADVARLEVREDLFESRVLRVIVLLVLGIVDGFGDFAQKVVVFVGKVRP